MRSGYGRTQGGAALAMGVALVLLLVGCGADDSSGQGPRPAVSGVLLDGPAGEPAASEGVELFVRPAAMGSGGAGSAPVDRATTDASGAFELAASVEELTPHAGADGRVQVEVRPAGAEVGTITAVRLEKDRDTGVARVVETTAVTVEMQP